MWQWFRFLLRHVPGDRPILRLNLDETSIRFWYEPRLGLRRENKKSQRAGCARQASRGQLRAAFTHIAIICDDTSLQPHLPQVLLVNERTVTAEQHRRWSSPQGCNVKLWRGKSAWINDQVFARVIRTLGKVLRERAAERQAILLMDAHVCHFSSDTLAACRAYDIWPVIIPARMTSLLQPLDTHVFSRFKMFLRTRLHQIMLAGANQDLTSEQVINALLHAIKGVLQGHAWAPAFAKNGFGQTFEVREHLLEIMAWITPPLIESDIPSYTQFAHCFPARVHIPFMKLLSSICPASHRETKRGRRDIVDTGTTEGGAIPWKLRLRPRHRGRARAAKAKCMPAPKEPITTESSAPMPLASVPMLSAGGHALPSLRPFPSRLRRSSSDLALESHYESAGHGPS